MSVIIKFRRFQERSWGISSTTLHPISRAAASMDKAAGLSAPVIFAIVNALLYLLTRDA